MKAYMQKSFLELPPSEQRKINSYLDEVVTNRLNETYCTLQEVWIKMSCAILHDAFGFDDEQLIMYLANYRREYRQTGRRGSTEENVQAMNERMEKVFKNGFPQEFIDRLKEM